MASYNIADYANALRLVILPYIQDNFQKLTITLNQLKRNAGVTHMNNNFHAVLRNKRHGGVTSLANDGNTTNATTGAGVTRGSVGVKIQTGAFNISKLAIDASAGNRDAIKNALSFQADSLITDFSRDLNRQVYGDTTGIVGQVAGSTSATVFTVQFLNASLDDGRSIDWYGSINGDIRPAEYLYADQQISIGTNGVSRGTISSVDSAAGTGTVTTTTAGTGAYVANDAVFITDGSGEGEGSNMWNGVHEALDSRTGTNLYAGVARSVDGWTPQFGSVSEALSLSRIELSYLNARKYSQEGDRYAIFVNLTLYKKYGDLLTSMRRVVNSTELAGGWTGLEFAAGGGKVGVFLDYQVPDGEVVIMNLDSWTVCQVSDMSWMEEANQNSLLRRADTITYQATLVWFSNIMCLAPAAMN